MCPGNPDPRPWKPWLSADPWNNNRTKVVDAEALAKKFESVRSWANGRNGWGRVTALYHMNAYLKWRVAHGLSENPDQWIKECVNGTNKALITHLKELH